MSDVIKIYQQKGIGFVDKITVFFGDSYDDTVNTLFLDEPENEIFKDIFSESELKFIAEQKVEVAFTNQRIYLDDSIETVKKKIIIENANSISFDEIYLYTKHIQALNNTTIYESLTQKGKMTITQDILMQFLSNIKDFDIRQLPIKETYDFNDIIALNLISKKQITDIPLGQYIITSDNLYSYTINPYRVINYSRILQTHAESIITTSNKELLLSYGFIFENSIFLCKAQDVLQNAIDNGISEKTTTQIYYPFLNEKDIYDKVTLNKSQLELIESNKQLLNSKFNKHVDNINLFHDIYTTRKQELKYIEQGIRTLEFMMFQNYEFTIPLDTVFKLIHATKKCPFIKFNPSNKKENIYRLYCDKTSKNGKKIPYLSKAKILKLIKSITMSKRVTCYIEHVDEDGTIIPIILGFDSGANIYVSIEFKQTKSIPSIENILKESINPFIEIIRNYLITSGYSMNLFSNLYDKNVDIIGITYNAYISIEKNINIDNLLGCVSSVFNVVIGELKKGIIMRYKRVANFNEMDSIDAFMVELLNRGNDDENIVKSIMDNFQMSEIDAQLKLAELSNNVQVIQNLGNRLKLKIKNNPGFLTKITQDQYKQNIMIEMENINSIFYMNVIPIYIDSIIRITQDPESISIDLSTIDSLCKTKHIDDMTYKDEIIADSEKPITQNIPVAFVAEDLKFGEDVEKIPQMDKSVNVMDFLFDDDSEEEYDEGIDVDIGDEFVGGINSSEDGVDIDLDSDEEDGVDIDLDSDEEDIDLDSDEEDGVDIDLDSDEEDIELASDEEDIELASDEEDIELASDGDKEAGDINRKDKIYAMLLLQYPPQEAKKILKQAEQLANKKAKKADKLATKEAKKADKLAAAEAKKADKLAAKEAKKAIKLAAKEAKKVKKAIKLAAKESSPKESSPKESSPKESSPKESSPKESSPKESSPKESSPKESSPKTTTKKSKRPKLSIQIEEKIENDITGMRIADPNPFFRSLREKDPTLFLTESDDKYSAYSRLCPWNKRRQPVVLTDEEKEKIDKEHPGSYSQAIKYGSNPDKKFWYICPRYWDLKNNVSLTKKEAESGKYGGIIPQKIDGKPVKKVPPGKNIWEFTDSKDHIDKDGKYIAHHPGFLKKDSHPDGICVPCCFKTWDSKSQQSRRSECNQDDKKEKKLISKMASKQELDEYIMGPDKFPLQEGRFGYLPIQIQRFLMIDNKTCQISSTNTNLIKNRPCYLRKGVDSSKNISFLGCIADVYSEINNDKIISIDSLIQDKLLDILTIDNFIKYQNGNLISEFQSKNVDDIDIELVKESKIYEVLHKSNIIQLKKIISSHNNFKLFLQQDSSVIDYKYLWDLICDKNKSLFPEGVNLIILELPQDDITSNVNIICPSNFYSNSKFDINKNTIILIKKYEYFEPIYIVTDETKNPSITSFTTIKMYTPELFKKLPNLKSLSKTVQDIYGSMCKPLPSILNTANKYNFTKIKFTQNKTLSSIIDILVEYKIDVVKTVINYDNKVVGLIISNDGVDGFIPCFPSGILTEYEMIMMDDISEYLMPFEATITFLQNISKKTGKEILCLPYVKIMEDELIIGILTQTNQFIELKDPEQNTDITITHTITDDNYYKVDKETQNTNKYDKNRLEYIKKIKIETDLFNSFRNKLKMLLSKFDNKNIRDEIENISNSKYIIYHLQLEKLIRLIKNLMKDDVKFVNISTSGLTVIEKALEKQEILLIPDKNLMSDLNNEELYYSKISDELIRYNRIKNFMFEPKMFLNFTNLKYDLNNNEIILLQSLLTHDYFDDLIPIVENKYVSFNSYDNVQPNITQKYDNEYIALNDPGSKLQTKSKQINSTTSNNNEREFKIYSNCPTETTKILKQLKLKFSGGFKEIIYSDENYKCSFDVLLTIVNNYPILLPDIASVYVLKHILIQEYNRYADSHSNEIVNIVKIYGKSNDYKLLSNNELSIEDLIMNEEYNLNIIDILIICDRYKIPITLLAPRKFKENDKEYISLNVSTSTYIVRVPAIDKYKLKPSKYKMLLKNYDGLISLTSISNERIINNIMDANVELIDIIKSFTIESDVKPMISKKTIVKGGNKLVLS